MTIKFTLKIMKISKIDVYIVLITCGVKGRWSSEGGTGFDPVSFLTFDTKQLQS